MTLIAILLVLAVERFVGAVDHLRLFGWFQGYRRWLENQLSRYSLWRGPLGVVIVLAPPLALLGLVSYGLNTLSPVLDFILACVVLLYSLGPTDLGHQVMRYTEALKSGDAETARASLAAFHDPRHESGDYAQGRLAGILCSLFEQANARLFAVLFWFVILGPVGALLYRLTAELHHEYAGVHGRFADGVRDLYNLLNWPTVRLSALGYALAGSLVEALDGWRRAEQRRLDVNERVLFESGLGALHFRQIYGGESEAGNAESGSDTHEPFYEDLIGWVGAARGLENRTLIIWLSVLAVMTIAGWAS